MKEKEKFASYQVEDLIYDDYFIHSTLYPTEEDEQFWQKLIEEKKLDPADFREAREIVRLFRRRKTRLPAKEKNGLWASIEIENKRRLKKRLHWYYGYVAASVIAVLCISGMTLRHFYQEKEFLSGERKTIVNSVFDTQEPEGEIRIILSDQKQLEVDGTKAEIAYESEGTLRINSEIYKSKTKTTPKTSDGSYNQLVVPKGKHSHLLLSDGTRMWVNAGTRVAYPEKFVGGKREIYVNGEVFLDVSPDPEKPFIVKTGQMDIRVHGTSLNITAYEQEEEHRVVLVTGAVTVTTKDRKAFPMVPDQLLSLSEDNLSLKKVDVREYITWKDGYLMYKNERLEKVFSQLAHYYGKKIEVTPQVDSLHCEGKLDLTDDFDYLLQNICDMFSLSCKKQGESYMIE